MLGVDTNVLVRFLSGDDEMQSAEAAALVARSVNQPVYLSLLVLAEAFTVMTKVKKYPAGKVLDAYRLLLRSPHMKVERSDLFVRALDDAARTRADLPDALIALQNEDVGCVATATFDLRASRLDAMCAVKDCL